MNRTEITREYCKRMKLKFVRFIPDGFLALSRVPIKAGMAVSLSNGELVSAGIKKIGARTITRKYLVYADGDVVIDRVMETRLSKIK